MKSRPRWSTVRRWLYASCLASGPLLVHYGLVEPEALPLWGMFLVAFLNVNDDPRELSDR